MTMTMPARIRLCLWAALLVTVTPPSAWAASCTISNSGISFGAYDPLSADPRDTNATIQNTCVGSAGENVSFSVGVTEVSGSGSNLSLSNGSARLQYNLYLDAGRTVIWGDGTNGTSMIQDSLTIPSDSVSKNYTVYGRIFGGQFSTLPGVYVDQLVITVSY